ncbi:MAG: hypothetical protein KDC92_13930, partial [Bacteroidetes bacterium]|nr:hypothetical protein [Bacteroidota bacterium]
MKNNVRVKRRTFIKQSALAGLSMQFPETLMGAEELNAKLASLKQLKSKSHIDELVTDKLYWKEIRRLYAADNSFLNLE